MHKVLKFLKAFEGPHLEKLAMATAFYLDMGLISAKPLEVVFTPAIVKTNVVLPFAAKLFQTWYVVNAAHVF